MRIKGYKKIFFDKLNKRKFKKRIIRKFKSKKIKNGKSIQKQSFKKKRVLRKSKNLVFLEAKKVKYRSYIERFCSQNFVTLDRFLNHNSIDLDSDFTLFNNPNKVLYKLREMLEFARKKSKYVDLNYKGEFSFGSLYLIDNMCWEIANSKKWRIRHTHLPIEERAILSKLRSIQSSQYETSNEIMINERIPLNRNDGIKGDQKYKVRITDITNMLNDAFKEVKGGEFELPEGVRHAINSTIGEHFDNILLHVPEADFGTLCGFYNKRTKVITLLIFNYGSTIYETLTRQNMPQALQNDIEIIKKNYTDKNYFKSKSEFSKENAITLLALQEGISSRITEDNTRGCGLIDFVENCFDVSNKTKIVIISGKTAIKIDNRYKIEPKNVLGRQNRRIIALNENNDIFEKPDPKYLDNLKVFFPGVIIETTIPLGD